MSSLAGGFFSTLLGKIIIGVGAGSVLIGGGVVVVVAMKQDPRVVAATPHEGEVPKSEATVTPPLEKIALDRCDYTKTKAPCSIYLMNPDGTGEQEVLEGALPAWSPDGRQLAFFRWGGPEHMPTATPWLVDVDNGKIESEPRRIPSDEFSHVARPGWSPDGKNLVLYTSNGAGDKLTVVPVPENGGKANGADLFQGSDGFELTGGAPSWSPDGQRLAGQFVDVNDGYTISWGLADANGENHESIAGELDAQGSSPQWSRDGKLIAFDGPRGIEVIDPSGKSRRTVFDTKAEGYFSAAVLGWSADSSKILIWAMVDGEFELQVVTVESGKTLTLGSGGSGSWGVLPTVVK